MRWRGGRPSCNGSVMFVRLIKWIDTWPKYFKFCLVGLSNSVVESCVYAILLSVGAEISVAHAISYSVMCVNCYCWNRQFTFKTKGKFWGPEMAKFTVVCFASLVLGSTFITILADHFHLQGSPGKEWAAKLLTMAFTNITDFSGSRLWVFQSHRHEEEKEAKQEANKSKK